PAAARRRDCIPVPVWRDRLLHTIGAAAAREGGGALAAERCRGGAARPCVHDVRVLLPFHDRRPQPTRRESHGGGRRPRRVAAHLAAARDSAAVLRPDVSHVEPYAAPGASRLSVLRRVPLPLLMPAIGGAALLVFMTSMGSFSAPSVFGGGFRVLSTQIFASKLNGDIGIAAVETIVLALVSILFLAMLQRYEAQREYTGSGKGLGRVRYAERPSKRRRVALSVLAWLIVIILLLPHATVLLVSFVPAGTWTTELFPPVYSL